jgi:hypothetical protein
VAVEEEPTIGPTDPGKLQCRELASPGRAFLRLVPTHLLSCSSMKVGALNRVRPSSPTLDASGQAWVQNAQQMLVQDLHNIDAARDLVPSSPPVEEVAQLKQLDTLEAEVRDFLEAVNQLADRLTIAGILTPRVAPPY